MVQKDIKLRIITLSGTKLDENTSIKIILLMNYLKNNKMQIIISKYDINRY